MPDNCTCSRTAGALCPVHTRHPSPLRTMTATRPDFAEPKKIPDLRELASKLGKLAALTRKMRANQRDFFASKGSGTSAADQAKYLHASKAYEREVDRMLADTTIATALDAVEAEVDRQRLLFEGRHK